MNTYRMKAAAGPHFLHTVNADGTVSSELSEIKPGQVFSTEKPLPTEFMDKFEEITQPDLVGAAEDDEVPDWVNRTSKFPEIEAKGLQVLKLRGHSKFKVTQGDQTVIEIDGGPELVQNWFKEKSKTEKPKKKK